ncbi:MAG: hypothetical protein WA160_14365 [Pseudobdellovibrio sp.]
MIKYIGLVCLLSLVANGSTFVGNGGNAGDLELQVTLTQVKRSLTDVVQNNFIKNQLCTCDESMEGHKICETLKVLNIEQKNYCEKKLIARASDMLDLMNDKQGLLILWTSEAMQVAEKSGYREAEGISVPEEKKILLNQGQFLELRDYERIFLVTHELGHLIKVSNKYLRDDEAIGPFNQADGGRHLLNALGASVAMKSLTNGGVNDYRGSLKRSKSYKQHWFNLSVGGDSAHNDESTFAIKKYSGYDTSYRFQLNQDIGFSLGLKYLHGDEKILQTVKAVSELNLWDIQAHYRIFPFSNPLSFWGQSHLIFGLGLESGKATIKLDDGYTVASDEAKLSSPIISVQYYLPLYVGLWISTCVSYTAHNYEYTQIGFKSEKKQIYLSLGVNYAF